MRWLMVAAILMVLLSGCVTEETKCLAQGVHFVQQRQEVVVKKLLRGVRATEEEELRIVREQEALTRATLTLSEILGEPEDSVEVGEP